MNSYNLALLKLIKIINISNFILEQKSFYRIRLRNGLFILGLRPHNYWRKKENLKFYTPFKIVSCFGCSTLFKEEGRGFFGGRGIRGEFMGFHHKNNHVGYCSSYCRMASEPNWDGGESDSSNSEI